MKIREIEERLKNSSEEEYELLLCELKNDGRAGVQKLIQREAQKKEKLKAEYLRIEQLRCYEKKYGEYSHICGIDEVGRGPLAGPVVAAAVILPKDAVILYINDSKKLSAKKREKLYNEIMETALAVGIGMSSHERIDEINILQATYEAMREAISNLSVEPDLLLNDAVTIPGVKVRQIPIIKGDAKSISIAAASIIAKVTRDKIMDAFDEIYPEYDFIHNKGYGTPKHLEGIKKYGLTSIHRKSFCNALLVKR